MILFIKVTNFLNTIHNDLNISIIFKFQLIKFLKMFQLNLDPGLFLRYLGTF
jgi:hypothetical protein